MADFEAQTSRDLHRYGMPIDVIVDDHAERFRDDVEAFSDAAYRQVWPFFSGAVRVP